MPLIDYNQFIEIILIINIGLILGLIFFQRRNPASVLAWTIILLALPLVGFVLYMLFGFHYFRERRFQLKAKGDRELLARIVTEQKREIQSAKALSNAPDVARFEDLAHLLLTENNAVLTSGNRVEVYTGGEQKFGALFEAIASARSHLHLEYYIIRNDDLGHRLVAALTEKAKEGVEVRLLYDDFGNNISKRGYRALVAAGGRVSGFYRSPLPKLGLRINYRNHRKIAVIDGSVGFIGGLNIGDEYLGKGSLGHWRDTAVRITGPAVAGLQIRFLVDWNYATNERIEYQPKYFPEPESTYSSDLKGTTETYVQIVSGGPDTLWNPMKEEYLKMIGIARKTVYIQSPYFIPDQSVLDALRVAALSGVDVRIMIPAKADAPFVHWAGMSYLGELLNAGAKGYFYNKGFLHAKTATVDDLCSSIGSANWDIRSFRLNFEANAVIYDRVFAQQQRRIFEDDLRDCTEITSGQYSSRSTGTKFKERVSLLFSGLI